MGTQDNVEELWSAALELSEDGRVHEAVLGFERARACLAIQREAAASVENAGRVRELLDELLVKLNKEARRTAR